MSPLPKPKPPTSTAMPAPTKVGTQATAMKMPKSKKMADPFGKPSLFFKSEDHEIKRDSIRKLHEFLEARKAKANRSANPGT